MSSLDRERNTDLWATELSRFIVLALEEFRGSLEDEVLVTLAFDVFPWHGELELSALTREELEKDPCLDNPSEIATWKHFQFSKDLESWKDANLLTEFMQKQYAAAENPQGEAELFFKTAAKVLRTEEIKEALAMFHSTQPVRITLSHPDTGEEFY